MKDTIRKISFGLLMCILVLFAGCQMDDEKQNENQEKNVNNYPVITEKYLTTADLEAMPKVKELLAKIINEKNPSSSDRSIYNPDYDIFIDTSKILRLDNGNYHSLTFPITRLGNKDGLTENLVLSSQDDGSYTVAIYKYELTEENKTAILNDEPTNITGYVSRTVLKEFNPNDVLSRTIQIFYTQIIVVPCGSGEHNGTNMGKWHQCTVSKKAQVLAITRSILIDIGNDDPIGPEIGSGGGGEVGGSGYTPPTFDPGNDFALVKGGLTKPVLNIKTPEEAFYYEFLKSDGRMAMQDSELRKPILQYLLKNGWSNESKAHAEQLLLNGDVEFLLWALDYLENNPDTTPEQLENWYMGTSEGKDGDYNATYWNNPNLTFPPQNLPNWQSFDAAYPRNANGSYMTGASNVFNHVGGAVLQARIDYPLQTDNPCALKVSIALNGAGITIPELYYPNGNPITLKGADGKFYFLNAKALNSWMKETFGTNPASLTTPLNTKHFQYNEGGTNGADFETAIKGKKGIFTMLPTNPENFGASGHCDKYDGVKCAAKCYFPHASEINIWVLD